MRARKVGPNKISNHSISHLVRNVVRDTFSAISAGFAMKWDDPEISGSERAYLQALTH